MAKPNISLLGATYSGVSGVTLLKSDGGTATFPWVEGRYTVTENGTFDVTALAEMVVNVAGGGGSGLTYEQGTYTPSSNANRPSIQWANSHTEAPILVAMADVSEASSITSNSNILFVYFDPYKIFGAGFPYSTSATRYAVAYYSYRGSSSTSSSASLIANNSDNTSSSSNSYPRYWVSPTDFHPYSNSNSRYWRAGRTYKWVAVWKP